MEGSKAPVLPRDNDIQIAEVGEDRHEIARGSDIAVFSIFSRTP